MIQKDNFLIYPDEDESGYPFKICPCCPLRKQCELVTSHIVRQVKKKQPSVLPVVAVNYLHPEQDKVYFVTAVPDKSKCHAINEDITVTDPTLYMMAIWENDNCPMIMFNVVGCGGKWVADGIGDDFKVDWESQQYRIERSAPKKRFYTNKWEPRQPVYISAQTGNGKNHFIENVLLKYIRELNHRYKTDHKILILSNRRALTEQTKDRLNRGFAEDDKIYYNGDFVDVMSYHSLLNKVEYLKQIQLHGKSKYLFVICDEAHFFTSDAAFNPDTEKILEGIVNIFQDAIRVYMTATPYECLEYIQKKESRYDKYEQGVLYHFERDYRYLNTKYFSKEVELKDIIINSVHNTNEKWLIFIDNKKQGVAFKKLLEYDNSEATALKGKVLTIDADSKCNNEKYQQMILNERFDKSINVVIATSVIDNGVNFRDIENVVITDINQTKCIQMVGRVRVGRDSNTKVTLYLKRHNESYISRRLKSLGVQQDAYHDYDMATQSRNHKWVFLDKYYNNDLEDWENAKHWFGRDKNSPNFLYLNTIARSLADKSVPVYESIMQEMIETDKGKKVTGQKYLEFQLSWFGKKYSKKHDITLNGYKNDGHLNFEKWIQGQWLNKRIPKEDQKEFGKKFFAKYHPLFGLCTKKQGFNSDDNRGESGPKTAGYGFKRINEIFRVRKTPFQLIEDNGDWIVTIK